MYEPSWLCFVFFARKEHVYAFKTGAKKWQYSINILNNPVHYQIFTYLDIEFSPLTSFYGLISKKAEYIQSDDDKGGCVAVIHVFLVLLGNLPLS